MMKPTHVAIAGFAALFAAGVQAQDASAALRASGQAGEQADGYMGIVGSGGGDLRARVDAVNAKRQAYYVDLASKRGAKVEEVAMTTACELLRTKIGAGQYYRLPDGAWRQREGGTPITLPGYCG